MKAKHPGAPAQLEQSAPSAKFRVAILLRLGSSPHRDRLVGIFNRLGPSDAWDIRLLADEAELRRVLAGDGFPADGIITFMPRETATRDALIASEIPLVAIGLDTTLVSRRRTRICTIHNDNGAVGRAACDFFLHLGSFSDFAFVHDRKLRPWSVARGDAFAHALKAAKRRRCRTFAPAADDATDMRRLADFLRALEKPAAVFVANDSRALDVLHAARTAGLDVPRDLSVIGVDDDTLLCEHARPRLTSIRIDATAAGSRAAEELRRLLVARRPAAAKSVSLPTCRGVDERESTRALTPAIRLMARARAYIAENALRGISPTDVANHLGISRRLLDLRFREFSDRTVLASITEAKLAEAKRLLRETAQPIHLVFEAAGFADNNYAHHLFKTATGLTPSDYRRRG